MDAKRKSPSDHAKDKKYMIRNGNDNNLWVSKPDKNNVFKWSKVNAKNFISIAASIPLKLKYDYKSFYSFFKRLKVSNTICDCHDDLLRRIENGIGLGLSISYDDEMSCRNSNNFTDDGAFYLDGYYERSLAKLYAKYPKKKSVIMFTSLDLIHAALTNGALLIKFDFNGDDKKSFFGELKEKFKQYKIKTPQKAHDEFFKVQLKKI